MHHARPDASEGLPCSGNRRRVLGVLAGVVLGGAAPCASPQSAAHWPDTVARVKASVVAVGTMRKTRVPQFQFLGTGFAVGDGSLVATNAHVVRRPLEAGADPEFLAIAVPSDNPLSAQVRVAHPVAEDPDRDLTLLRVPGPPLPALILRDSDKVREGEHFLFTGFPLGSLLGLFAATHRALIAAVTPIAIPPANSRHLDPALIQRLKRGAFPIFQLDATSYPGNSGSPLYDPATGEVVGILNMAFVKGTKESALTSPSGIAYAIPSKYLQSMISAAR